MFYTSRLLLFQQDQFSSPNADDADSVQDVINPSERKKSKVNVSLQNNDLFLQMFKFTLE